ncbi:NADP-specific glutamate dehydrogenase [Verticillium dahliae VdLs.17]|uniref:Glutamate dehydrogenase n=1 Tax=Verticillium dahliae (strain VdLs.17 / ATCC MYA-4575 / FGSC 10137) TaxID=498257 RepID=G2XDV7_VERDV|nr:NADP-specific glutamate dehydrogenase [Verticillium dahliae VdLs.17]EGY18005.1 NADP-specific glutamate dehydrogenase [Verticillium dahliae VdLs.17]
MSHLPVEPEFLQAYSELVSTLEDSTLFSQHPEFRTALEVVSIPERVIQFRVVWEDDKGNTRVNRGYRVQFNSALGPYKGGLRFHPTVNLSVLKFLGFEQIFKNALTGLNIGGGKGGADINPKDMSDAEIRRFCVAFMRQLSKHIGADTDVPAGDIGVGGREIGHLFGTYRQERNKFEGVLTGKGNSWGGSLIRPEATGYGLVYYVDHMLQYAGKGGFAGKRVAISGSGNVAQYAALAKPPAAHCCLPCPTPRAVLLERKPLTAFRPTRGAFMYIKGAPPLDPRPARSMSPPPQRDPRTRSPRRRPRRSSPNGVLAIAEGSNMGCTQEAIDVFEETRKTKRAAAVWYGPGKAANCGGVAVSGLEMAQNSQRLSWTREEVDEKLKDIMKNAFLNGVNTAKQYVKTADGELPSLVAGSNIAGFVKVARAMHDQGDWWN